MHPDDIKVGNFVYLNSLNRSGEYLVRLIREIKKSTVLLDPFIRLWGKNFEPSRLERREVPKYRLENKYRASKQMKSIVKHAIIQCCFLG